VIILAKGYPKLRHVTFSPRRAAHRRDIFVTIAVNRPGLVSVDFQGRLSLSTRGTNLVTDEAAILAWLLAARL
jgi:hypothetical protein